MVSKLSKSSYQIFQQESPEVAAAFNKLVETLARPSALDSKTKQLLYIAMKIVTDDVGVALAHVPFAKKAGVSREELRETVLLTGLQSRVVICLGVPVTDAAIQKAAGFLFEQLGVNWIDCEVLPE